MKLTNQTRFCINFLHHHSFLTISPQTHGLFRTTLDEWQTIILFNKTVPDGLNMLYGYSIFLHPINQRCAFIMFVARQKNAAFIPHDDFLATKKDYEFFNNQIIGLTTYRSFELQYFYENKK